MLSSASALAERSPNPSEGTASVVPSTFSEHAMRNFTAIILISAMLATAGCARISRNKTYDGTTGEPLEENVAAWSFWTLDQNQFALSNTDGSENISWNRSVDGVTGPGNLTDALASVGALYFTGRLPNFTPQAATTFDPRGGFTSEQPNEVTAQLMTRMKEIESRSEQLEAENARLQGEINAMHGSE